MLLPYKKHTVLLLTLLACSFFRFQSDASQIESNGVTTHPAGFAISAWQHFPAGPLDAITDVKGIQVGHLTVRANTPVQVRTGVTAIVPDISHLSGQTDNLATGGVYAGVAVLNGNGELTGQGWLEATGLLNSPIMLTNTWAVGTVDTGVFDYYRKHFPNQWAGELPVVGECWDGVFNTITYPAVSAQDAISAIESAKSGPLLQGRVGAGTGMRSFQLHAGIGSASRQIQLGDKTYTIGVLVNTNHSRLQQLNPLLRSMLEARLGNLETVSDQDAQDAVAKKQVGQQEPTSRQGSIMVVIATDAPLLPHQLKLLAEHAALGIGDTGSIMATSSGDFALALSTAQVIPISADKHAPVLTVQALNTDALTPFYAALTEAVVEAQMNAILASHTK